MIFDIVLVSIIGLLAGGVVNVLSDDLPLRRPLRLPRYVPDEKKAWIHLEYEEDEPILPLEDDEQRPVIAWLGLTAFLFGKRESPSGIRLNWRYPLTELMTMGLMLLTYHAVVTSEHLSGIGIIQLMIWLTYMVFFTTIIVIDIEHKLILFVVIIPFGGLALFDALLTTAIGDGFYLPELRDALIGGVSGFAVFFFLYNGGFLFTYIMGMLRGEKINEVAFGYGDVLMATVSGLVLGWQVLIFAMFVTVFLGAFGAILYLVSRRLLGQEYSAFTAIPYGPYIVIGTISLLLYRVPVTGFLMGY